MTKQKVRHTPTPWHVEPYAWDEGKSLVIIGGKPNDSIIVARIAPDSEDQIPRKLDEANIAFIVRAVNAHDALVKALKAVTAELVGRLDGTNKSAGEKRALALAEKVFDEMEERP
jgi:hypothetical protein